MKADDPRHGTRAGYIAGCREDCCRVPHVRYQKRATLRRLREGSQYVDPAPILARVEWWARYGITDHAIAQAAGLSSGTLRALHREGYKAEKATMRAALAVTWDDLPDSTLVNAALTQLRINSLMAAGHTLEWICSHVDRLNVGGKWRTQERVTLGLARGVQELYESAPTWGPSRHTATKARNRGCVTPAAWDDPGTPAMPRDWKPELGRGENTPRAKTDVDEAVVLRLLDGERMPATTAERHEAMRRWLRMGRSEAEMCRVHGWKDSRYGREDAA